MKKAKTKKNNSVKKTVKITEKKAPSKVSKKKLWLYILVIVILKQIMQ